MQYGHLAARQHLRQLVQFLGVLASHRLFKSAGKHLKPCVFPTEPSVFQAVFNFEKAVLAILPAPERNDSAANPSADMATKTPKVSTGEPPLGLPRFAWCGGEAE